MHGQFVWYELTTPDVDAAKKFYPPITGWGTQQYDNDYTLWTNGGVPVGGIFRLGPEQRAQGIPPNWMPYIEANNVDDTARLATSLGGKVIVPGTDIPNTGRFAVLQDPQGATFGVYRANGPSRGWDGTPLVGRFSWHELMTTDYQKAFDFYRKLFGWEKTSEMDMGGGNMYFMYGKGGKPYGGMFNRMPDMGNVPPFWLNYIFVKDVKKAVDATTRGGGVVKRPPMEIPGGMIAILGDPQGAGFAVHQQTAQAAAPKSKPAKKAAAKKRPKAKAAAKKKPARKIAAAKKRSPKKRSPKKRLAKKAARRTAKKAKRGRR